MEDITEKSTQTVLTMQKNVENLEAQIGEITQELRELKDKCKSITTRSEIVIGRGIGDNLQSEERDIESKEKRRSEERINKEKREKQMRRYRKKRNLNSCNYY